MFLPLRLALTGQASGPDMGELLPLIGEDAARIRLEAAARGAAEAGGLTVGILRGSRGEDANLWIQVPLPTGLGDARNALVVAGAEVAVAVGGSWGTLSEIALAKKMGLDVGTLGSPPADGLELPALEDPRAAAEWALERAAAFRDAG